MSSKKFEWKDDEILWYDFFILSYIFSQYISLQKYV